MDLQAVLLFPRKQASALYYKTNLACRNFTDMDLAIKSTTRYFWNKSDSDLSASSFAPCICDLIQTLLEEQEEEEVKDIVLHSDGCNHQHSNMILSNARFKSAIDNKQK